MKTLSLLSGGYDSVCMTEYLRKNNHELIALLINYRQRHKKEIKFAKQYCIKNNIEFYEIEIIGLNKIMKSYLFSALKNPVGHETVVNNRNSIFLSMAYGIAIDLGCENIAIGVNKTDYAIYRDCRNDFIQYSEMLYELATEKYVKIITPFFNKTKKEIFELGLELGISKNETWTCYNNYINPCGFCGSCLEMKKASE